jgi:hypothetical protein
LVLSDGRADRAASLRSSPEAVAAVTRADEHFLAGVDATFGAIVIVAARRTAAVAPRLSSATWLVPACLIEASATAAASERLASVGAF